MKKIKILHLVPGLDAGGISVLLLNYYKEMDRKKFQFDFAIFYDYIGMTGKEFEKFGSKIYMLPKKTEDLKGYVNKIKEIILENKYDIVHVHHGYLSFIALKVAKECGVKVRISHSHSAKINSGIKQKAYYFIGKILNNFYVTDRFACGLAAGEFLYGKNKVKSGKVFILNNAISCDKFFYNEDMRKMKRKELGWNDKFIIGTVGRLCYEKNHKFAIDVFERIYENNKKARLVIVGNGELENELKEYIAEKNLNGKALLLGKRDDVNELLQAMDVFILPSIQEGLPVSGVEAISTSIPVIFSDAVTKELQIRENIDYISLKDKEMWVEAINSYNNFKRKENSKEIINNIYNIKNNAKQLEQKYTSLLKG